MTRELKIAEIKKYVYAVVRILGLEGWTVNVKFASLVTPDDKETAAECDIRTEYKLIRITFDVDQIEPEHIYTTVRHELCHVFSAALWTYAEQLCEYTTEEEALRVAGEGGVTMLETAKFWNLIKLDRGLTSPVEGVIFVDTGGQKAS